MKKKPGQESYVVTAIPRGDRVHVAFNIVDRDETFAGSALIDVDAASLKSSLVYESANPMIDYLIDRDGWHCILMQDCIIEIEPGGKPVVTLRKVPDGLYRMSALGDRSAIICGDSGKVVVYAKRKLVKVPADTGATDPRYVEDLRSIHFATPGRGYAVGNYGAFLSGTSKKLVAVASKKNPFAYTEDGRERRYPVLAVYETATGAVLLGSAKGPALVYARGKFTTLTGLPPDAVIVAMTEYGGKEYWSADSNELYVRNGTKLSKLPAEAGGYRMEANESRMASSCGSFVYLFDGKWTRLRINPDPKRLVEKLKLDF